MCNCANIIFEFINLCITTYLWIRIKPILHTGSVTLHSSGETLCRDNCQLIGMPYFHTRSAGKNNQEISVLKIIFKGANGCLLFLKNCHTSNISRYNVIFLEHITFTSIQTNISKSSSDHVLARPAWVTTFWRQRLFWVM